MIAFEYPLLHINLWLAIYFMGVALTFPVAITIIGRAMGPWRNDPAPALVCVVVTGLWFVVMPGLLIYLFAIYARKEKFDG